jgi:phosphinothricin acetyltransferase
MSLTIRPAAAADIPAIAAIYRPAVRTGTSSWEIEPPDEAELARRREAILAGGYPYLAAEKDGAVVGYAYASAYRPRPAYRATVENSIYVAPAAQGAGVGRALLRALMAECATRGFRQMVAVIGDGYGEGPGSGAASRKLHEALGFAHAGVVRAIGFKGGRWLDQVLMQKALGSGDTAPLAD